MFSRLTSIFKSSEDSRPESQTKYECPHSRNQSETLQEFSRSESCPSLNVCSIKKDQTSLNEKMNSSQNLTLSTNRKVSSIPNGKFQTTQNDQTKWVYPSSQMFYNAMKRKGYSPNEIEMDNIVQIHNEVNERTWRHILEWEELHPDSKPQLIRFCGRPNDISPRARIRWLLFDYPLPFDRHDWIINRNGIEVRYVIDFYSSESINSMELPITLIDARPALDSISNIWDRFRFLFKN